MQVQTTDINKLGSYIYTVIFARYKNQWIFCRHRDRDVFETAGGRIEPGETPLEAARREFYEETGAASFTITPAFDYTVVHSAEDFNHGQVFFAEVHELGQMPDFEMVEVGLFDNLPERLRFPLITPVLFARLLVWLNARATQDELLDIYDADGKPTGVTHRRGDPLPPEAYILVVNACLLNTDGRFLITKRAPTKGYANMWEFQGGCALAGDDSLTAVIREAKEEAGMDVKPENGRLMFRIKLKKAFLDVWVFIQDFDINDVVLQPGETVDAKFATMEEILEMHRNGEFFPDDFFEELFEKSREMLRERGLL